MCRGAPVSLRSRLKGQTEQRFRSPRKVKVRAGSLSLFPAPNDHHPERSGPARALYLPHTVLFSPRNDRACPPPSRVAPPCSVIANATRFRIWAQQIQVHRVPNDGDCFFSSIKAALPDGAAAGTEAARTGRAPTVAEMRNWVAEETGEDQLDFYILQAGAHPEDRW